MKCAQVGAPTNYRQPTRWFRVPFMVGVSRPVDERLLKKRLIRYLDPRLYISMNARS